jgi:ATP-dependent DNA helicase RecG
MNARDLLQRLNLLDENERIEAKRARETGKSILETLCALANEPALGGGWLLLGVTRDEDAPYPVYQVQGVPNPDKLSADLASQCASIFNQPLRVDISTETLEGKSVIVVHVSEAAPQDKPIYFQATGLPKGAFRRIGSSDQRCTENDLEILFQSRQRESFDLGIMADCSLDDLDEAAIADYRKYRAEANPVAEELRWSNTELLQSLHAIRRDATGQWKPTVAGVLLFGKPIPLKQWFPMTARVDYIRVPGSEWVPDPDRRFDSVEIRAPLFFAFRRALAAVLDDLPKTFGLPEGAVLRTETPAIPVRALREALVNALMHRSYRVASPMQIIRYANRIEIRNAGFSLKPPEELGEPGSVLRNPVIANVFHDTRLAESKGSGIRAMRDAMEAAGLVPPLFESNRGSDLFVARFLFHHFLGEDDIRWLARFRDLRLSDEEARALIAAREAGAIDNATYRALNKVDTVAASAALRRLRDAGLFSQQGRGAATWYKPTEWMIGDDGEEKEEEGLSGMSEPLSGMSEPLSREFQGLSSKSGPLSSKSRGLSSKSESLSSNPARAALLDQLPGQLAARVGALGQRHPPEMVRDLVVDLCQFRAWGVDELALLLQRNPESVRQNYLRPLLARQRIAMTLPDTPNSPQQAYRSAEGVGNE